ncbi:MAG: hypothetical protein HQM08_08175 [Candidatus Riflebacteria bacterium]|nr:hypothetical protein [Candidatus Riflebacteria bacterium]
MKKLITLFILLIFCQSIFASQTGGWAIVNMRLLMVLHPQMSRFDYVMGRFFRDSTPQKNRQEIQREMNQAWETSQPVIKNLLDKQSRLIKNRYDIRSRIIEEANGALQPQSPSEQIDVYDFSSPASGSPSPGTATISINPGASSSGPQKNNIKEAVLLEQKIAQKIAAIDIQLQQVQVELQNAQESAYSPIYLTTPETNEVVKNIRTELSAILSQTAQESGISTVLDTSFSEPTIKLSNDICTIPSQPDSFENLSCSLFHSFTNWDIPSKKQQIPVAGGPPVDYQSHVVPRLMQEKLDNFRQYLDFNPYLTSNIAHFSPGNIFLMGGYDLTPLVARKIFEKYQIPVEVKNALINVLQEYLSQAINRSAIPQSPMASPPPSTEK